MFSKCLVKLAVNDLQKNQIYALPVPNRVHASNQLNFELSISRIVVALWVYKYGISSRKKVVIGLGRWKGWIYNILSKSAAFP